MKNKKSNIPTFVSTVGLACLLLLAGYSGDDALTPAEGGNAIRFTSTVARFTGSDGTDAKVNFMAFFPKRSINELNVPFNLPAGLTELKGEKEMEVNLVLTDSGVS